MLKQIFTKVIKLEFLLLTLIILKILFLECSVTEMLHHHSLDCSHFMQICILVGFESFFFTSTTYKLAIHELKFTQFRETGMSGFSASNCIHSGKLETINILLRHSSFCCKGTQIFCLYLRCQHMERENL